MRVSTANFTQQNVQQLVRLGAQLAKTQLQVASGRRIQIPSDDPLGSAQMLRLQEQIDTRATYLANLDSADTQLSLEDGVLAQATDVLQRVMELTLQAGNPALGQSDRGFLAAEIRTRLSELQTLASARGETGEYLFGGYTGNVAPFSDNLEFQGNAGQRQLDIDLGQRIAVNDTALQVFQQVRADKPSFVVRVDGANLQADLGRVSDSARLAEFFPADVVIRFAEASEGLPGQRTYTVLSRSDQRVIDGLENVPYSGRAQIEVAGMTVELRGAVTPGDQVILETTQTQSALLTLERLASGLERGDNDANHERFRELIDSTLTNLDSSMSRIAEVRAALGARLNAIDSKRDLHEELTLLAQGALSKIRDVDYAEAVSRLANESFILEAAQQSFIRVSQLSLFSRL